MSLTSLPTELLHQIVKEQLPEGLESIALTCKRLYQVSESFFAYHKSMRDRYEHVAFRNDFYGVVSTWNSYKTASDFTLRHVGELLERIAEEPIIARYIRTADLKDALPVDAGPPPVHNELGSVLSKLAGNAPLYDLVKGSVWPYLRDAGLDPENLPDDFTYGVDIPILLTMLPNLRQLSLPSWWTQRWGVDDPQNGFVDAIIRRANDKENYPDASLSKLSVIAPSEGSGYDDHESLQAYDPFLALTSLREFYSGGAVAEVASGEGAPFHPRYAAYSPQLKKMELVGAVMGQPEWARLLSRTPGLEVLHMSHETKYESLGNWWDVGATMATIQKTAGPHLRELCLQALNCYDTGSTLTDMSGFACLQTLELETEMLLCASYEDNPRRRFEGEDDEHDEEDDGGDPFLTEWAEELWRLPPHQARLVDILPRSIETVRLIGFYYPTPLEEYKEKFDLVRKLFRDFALERPSKLPALLDVSISGAATDAYQPPEYKEMLSYLEGEGCSIVDGEDSWCSQLDERFYKRFGVTAH